MLWKARREVLPAWLDTTDQQRAAWVHGLTDADLDIDLGLSDFSFVLLGDPGEGDRSQYAVAEALRSLASDTRFALVCTDVQYPAGDVNDFIRPYWRPFDAYPAPIYALPGNHDWYDGLTAFMHHLCGVPAGSFDEERWRREGGPALRASPAQRQPVAQRGPYYRIRTEHLSLVCIDAGIRDHLDEAQGRWLLRMSKEPGPKLLVTGGTPLYVNGRRSETRMLGAPDGYRTVHDVVLDPVHDYIGAVGGDTHNYQRYPVRRRDGRLVQCLVAGGGGAFAHATHTIGRIDPARTDGVTEEEFRCYPLRRDSLAAFSRVLAQRFFPTRAAASMTVSPDDAAHTLGERFGVAPLASRPVSAVRPRVRARIASGIVRHLGGRLTQRLLAPVVGWRNPPFFKHFLRVDVSADGVRVRCLGVTGCREHDDEVHVEDEWHVSFARPRAG